MVKTIEQILEENALAFSPNMEPHYMAELEGIWNDACIESGGDVTDAQVDEYLDVHADTNSFVTLLARIPADHIYLRHKFEYIDPARRYGMIRHQDDREPLPYSPK